MKRLLLITLVTLSAYFGYAQSVSSDQLQHQYNIGISFRNTGARERMFLPKDTLPTADSGVIAYMNGRLWLKTNTYWMDYSFKQVDDSTYVFAGDTFHIAASFDVIELSDSTFRIGNDTLKYRSIYNTNGKIPGTRTVDFQGTGILNMQNMYALDWSGATGGYQLQANPSWLRIAHFLSGTSKEIRMGDLPNQGIKLSAGATQMYIDTSAIFKVTGLKRSSAASDSVVVYDPSSGQFKIRDIAFFTPTLQAVINKSNILSAQNNNVILNDKYLSFAYDDLSGTSGTIGFNEVGRPGITISGNSDVTFPGIHFIDPSAPSTISAISNGFTGMYFSSGAPGFGSGMFTVRPNDASIQVLDGAGKIRGLYFNQGANKGVVLQDKIDSVGYVYDTNAISAPIAVSKVGRNWVPYWGAVLDTVATMIAAGGGGGGIPAGSSGDVQFNDAGAFGAYTGGNFRVTTPGGGYYILELGAATSSGIAEIKMGGSAGLGLLNFPGAGGIQATSAVDYNATNGHKFYTAGGLMRAQIFNNGDFAINQHAGAYQRLAFALPSGVMKVADGLQYEDSNRTVKTGNFLATNHVHAGDSSLQAPTTKMGIFYGDSYVAATTINPAYIGQATQIANLTNVYELNRGIGGTRMVSQSGSDSSMENRIYTIPPYSASIGYIYFYYGTNDATTLAIDTATFRTVFNKVLDSCIINRLYPLSKIYVQSNGYFINSNPTIQARIQQFANIAEDLAIKKGVVAINTYDDMVNNGGALLLSADLVHPNERGIEVIVNSAVQVIKGGGTARVNGYINTNAINVYQVKNPVNASLFTGFDTTRRPVVEIRGKYNGTNTESFGFGLNALRSITSGQYNVALGTSALTALTTGTGNVALGSQSLLSNLAGNSNTAIGMQSLRLATGNENTAVGRGSATAVTTGAQNTAIGFEALNTVSTGSLNSALGYFALHENTASNNSAFGSSALRNNTSGTNNIAMGLNALFSNLTGSGNTGVGVRALRGNLGSNNTGIGFQSGDSLTSASANTFIGYQSGYRSKAVLNNTFIGYQSGRSNTTGNYNTFIGGYVGKDTGLNQQVGIADGEGDLFLYADMNTLKGGVFTDDPTEALDVNGKIRARTISTQATPDSVAVITDGVIEKSSLAALSAAMGVAPPVSVTGDISAPASSLNLDFGNIRITYKYKDATDSEAEIRTITGSTTIDASMNSFVAGSAITGATFNAFNLTTTPNTFFATVGNDNNDRQVITVRENSRVWECGALLSGNGARVTLWAKLVYQP